jgi:kynurenine formamidase
MPMPESDRKKPTSEEIDALLRERRNWGRWGASGSAGAMNMVTPEKRRRAADLVKSGRAVSLSRPLPVQPSTENPQPVHHYMRVSLFEDGSGGSAMDYIGIYQHGFSVTHIDALCHHWGGDGMWDGHDPGREIGFDGARQGSVDAWSDGVMTRGVLLDVPKHRGRPYVEVGSPVHGWELEEIAAAQGVELEPGDALLLNCGRESYAADHGGIFYDPPSYPGVHPSCMEFIRDHDVALLGWDMSDDPSSEYGMARTVHAVLSAFGVAIVDNALLEPLAQACAEEGRYEFMLTVNPLIVVGGTGSPVNPIATF